jgi:hypothetical protein
LKKFGSETFIRFRFGFDQKCSDSSGSAILCNPMIAFEISTP